MINTNGVKTSAANMELHERTTHATTTAKAVGMRGTRTTQKGVLVLNGAGHSEVKIQSLAVIPSINP